MTLWGWAEQTWDRPGVGAACLSLQDDHEQCVPLLLWALWRSENGGMDLNSAECAVAMCRSMDSAVIAPLRTARRNAPLQDRERLLVNELKAEHELLDRLEILFDSGERSRRSAAVDLAEISALWGRPLDPAAFFPLIDAIAACESVDV